VTRVKDGKISSIRDTFDPRPLTSDSSGWLFRLALPAEPGGESVP
jgi:hypothetical protein